MSEIVSRVKTAMKNAVIRDDEGEFPRLVEGNFYTDDMVLVPRDPTEEMLSAGEAEMPNPTLLTAAYRAMVGKK